MNHLPEIKSLIARGALFVANHSGGKDSQAMLIKLLEIVPRSQLIVVHASLGRFEWHGAKELAAQQAAAAGVDFFVATAIDRDGNDKDFLTMVEKRAADDATRPCFPSAKHRQCTSDLKRGPIEKVIIREMKKRGCSLVVNCEGVRGAESRQRAKRRDFVHLNLELDSEGQVKDALARAGREAYDWLPIFDLQTLDVWCVIRGAGQQPHQAYLEGNERLSCVFCIMGSDNDILRGSIARPELFAEMVAAEERLGYTMHQSRRSLLEIVEEAKLAA